MGDRKRCYLSKKGTRVLQLWLEFQKCILLQIVRTQMMHGNDLGVARDLGYSDLEKSCAVYRKDSWFLHPQLVISLDVLAYFFTAPKDLMADLEASIWTGMNSSHSERKVDWLQEVGEGEKRKAEGAQGRNKKKVGAAQRGGREGALLSISEGMNYLSWHRTLPLAAFIPSCCLSLLSWWTWMPQPWLACGVLGAPSEDRIGNHDGSRRGCSLLILPPTPLFFL